MGFLSDAPWSNDGILHRLGVLEAHMASDIEARKAVEDKLANLEKTLGDLVERMDSSEKMQNDHNVILAEIRSVLQEMRDLLSTWNRVKSTITVGRTIGDSAVWLTKAVAACALIFAAFKYKTGGG